MFAYVLSLRDAWRHTRPFRARLRCDGRAVELRAIQVTVGNGRHYGGGMTVSENAAIDDGWLDVYACGRAASGACCRCSRRCAWAGCGTARRARDARPHHRGEHAAAGCPVNTDGDLTTYTPAEFKVVPGALEVFVPASYQGARKADDAVAERAADRVA